MERENYFILLELEPSVSDAQTIEARITEKERKWKDRALITNKSEYKRLVELIPDIRKCMLNPQERAKEAKLAVFAAVSSTKLEAARKTLPESYTKIEEALKQFNCTDIYEFLSLDPVSGGSAGNYGPNNATSLLTGQSKKLIETYRNISRAADKMQAASLIADFFDSGYKRDYDTYILLDIKLSLCMKIDTLADVGMMNSDALTKLISNHTRRHFTQKEVKSFIHGYCEFKGYSPGKADARHTYQPQTAYTPPKPPEPYQPAPTQYQSPNNSRAKTYRDHNQRLDKVDNAVDNVIETITHGEKEIRGTLGFGALNFIGFKAWLCVGLFALCFTVAAAPFAAPAGWMLAKSLIKDDRFVGFGAVFKGAVIVVIEVAVCIVIINIAVHM